MTLAAYTAYLLGLVLAFGVRTWLQLRHTGSTGFNGISGRPGSAAWWGGVLFVLALALGLTGPVPVLLGLVGTPAGPVAAVSGWVGMVLLVVGILLTMAAQSGMGTSWRIGVDEGERTDLVTTGLFRYSRNPIFTALIIAQIGYTLAIPTVLTVLALGALIAAIHLQVTVIEEPYLRRIHGAKWTRYATRTGRFLPRRSRSA